VQKISIQHWGFLFYFLVYRQFNNSLGFVIAVLRMIFLIIYLFIIIIIIIILLFVKYVVGDGEPLVDAQATAANRHHRHVAPSSSSSSCLSARARSRLARGKNCGATRE
jgi:hypothetical protein